MKFSIAVLSLVSSALAAYVPSEPWSTLTPTATQTASCAVSDYTQSFGIAISTITSAVNVKAKRDVTQTADGQVEVNTATEESFSTITFSYSSTTATAASHSEVIATQIGDGQIQIAAPQSSSYEYRTISSKTEEPSSSSTACPTAIAKEATCKNSNDLAITLKDGVLKDSHDRIGSIVSNRQFQFDGPTPQAGAIYAGGWSIVDGKLALGDDDIFWECLSGDFYNLYDEAIAEQCTPVALSIVDLVDC